MESGKRKTENTESKMGDLFPVIDGEILEIPSDERSALLDEEETFITPKTETDIVKPPEDGIRTEDRDSRATIQYIFLPFVFFTVALLGGLRIGIEGSEFLFVRPALICLVFATILMILFFRAKLLIFESWFSEDFSAIRNAANGAVFVSLFAASTQLFNSLIPEQGLPFWVISFCFSWTLWNNLFAEFDPKRLLKSLGGLFGFAFVAKYLVLANLVSGGQGSWLARLWQDPAKEAVTYFLDLPRFASSTGYIQFFALVFFLIGLFFLSPKMDGK